MFVDVGNKHIGLQALMKHLKVKGSQTLHVGDRFTLTGNDSKVRESASILWVANPDETTFFMRLLYRDILNARACFDLLIFEALVVFLCFSLLIVEMQRYTFHTQ